MQQAKREFFKDRMIFYASNLIYHQGKSISSDWNYELPEVYLIAIMDFSFDHTHPGQYEHDVRLVDLYTQTEFYSKLGYIFIEMPKFQKSEGELETGEDAWLFSLRNMSTLTEIPVSLRDKEEFVKLFKIAEVSNLDQNEMDAYEASLKIARDNYSHDETVRKEAILEGERKGRIEGLLEGEVKGKLEGLLEGEVKGKREQLLETARGMKNENLPVELIAKLTNLTVEELNSL